MFDGKDLLKKAEDLNILVSGDLKEKIEKAQKCLEKHGISKEKSEEIVKELATIFIGK